MRQTIIEVAVVLLLFVTAIPCRAGEWFAPLSKEDMAWMGANTALLGVDWGQTRYIAFHPDGWHEFNPLLGHHPSPGTVNSHFAVAIPLYWLTTWALPPEEDHGYKRIINRETFSIAITIAEGANVGNNARVGIGMRF
jgi:hypothetical protein